MTRIIPHICKRFGMWVTGSRQRARRREGSVVEGDGKARECDFDAEARRRGDQRGEAAKAKRGTRRQRRIVAFGSERTGFGEVSTEKEVRVAPGWTSRRLIPLEGARSLPGCGPSSRERSA